MNTHEIRNPVIVMEHYKSESYHFSSSFLFSYLKGRQRGFLSPAWPPRRDSCACGQNIVSGGEVWRLCDWRLRSDMGLFS